MNLARLVDEHYDRFGDYEANYFEGKWYSTGEGRRRAHEVGAGLQDLGVRPGDRVAVMLPNCPEVGISYWATWRIGGVVTPLIFLLPPSEVNRILADSEAKVAITSSELLPALAPAAEGVGTLEHIVCVGGAEGVTAYEELENHGSSEIVECEPDDLAALLYTGGTTGASKGVMLSHNNLEWTARAARIASEVKDGETSLLALPLSHSFGLHVSILGALGQNTNVLLRWFDPKAMLDMIQEYHVQRMAVVPTMLQLLLAMPLDDWDLSSLQFITTGAAALPTEVLEQWESRVPNCALIQGYGLTETSPTISVQPPSSVRDGSRRIGTVGKPIEGVEVRVVADDGQVLGSEEVGEVVVRGPNVMLGYWRNPEATEDAVVDGWFHTGDLGKLDAEGNLVIVDRKKDLIIRGGFNVYPVDVEAVLLKHPDVAEAALVGRPSETWGEEPVAFVVSVAGRAVDPDDVMSYCETNLAKYKRPVELKIVDSIPKTPVGKIDKKLLRAEFV